MLRKISAESPDRLVVLIGEVIVVWSQIEATWAHIFFNLLYEGFGAKATSDPETGGYVDPEDSAQKRERAAAVYFSIPNSRNQRRMVVSLAEVALAKKPKTVEAISKLARKTDKLSEWRNRLAHAYYDRDMTFEGTKIIYGDLQVSPHGKYKFSEAQVEKQIEAFQELDRKMGQLLLATFDLDELPEV